ncbi:MAG: anthranilate phosphoribosyltransferase [Bacillota bacterium]|nr:anthranilate phosphoribosyltransferase [Bacillota bacterium]
MVKEFLEKVISREHLSEQEAEVVMGELMQGNLTNTQIGAFLVALRMKGETPGEISGFARAIRSRARSVQISPLPGPVVDTCGTGGDGKHTFNISTAAAFVAAGTGLVVAKHGNRSISSRTGSADLLEALGLKIDLPVEATVACLREVGIAFFFAPLFHQAMRYALGPRRELGIRTVFNLLGPLTNPAGADIQLVGVYHADLTELVGDALRRLGCRSALVVHGCDGLDEISITGPTKITEVKPEGLSTYYLHPEELGLPLGRLDELIGGSPEENAKIFYEVLQGVPGSRRNVVLLNSAAVLLAAERAPDWETALALAEESIDRGAAFAKFEALKAFTGREIPC